MWQAKGMRGRAHNARPRIVFALGARVIVGRPALRCRCRPGRGCSAHLRRGSRGRVSSTRPGCRGPRRNRSPTHSAASKALPGCENRSRSPCTPGLRGRANPASRSAARRRPRGALREVAMVVQNSPLWGAVGVRALSRRRRSAQGFRLRLALGSVRHRSSGKPPRPVMRRRSSGGRLRVVACAPPHGRLVVLRARPPRSRGRTSECRATRSPPRCAPNAREHAGRRAPVAAHRTQRRARSGGPRRT